MVCLLKGSQYVTPPCRILTVNGGEVNWGGDVFCGHPIFFVKNHCITLLTMQLTLQNMFSMHQNCFVFYLEGSHESIKHIYIYLHFYIKCHLIVKKCWSRFQRDSFILSVLSDHQSKAQIFSVYDHKRRRNPTIRRWKQRIFGVFA